MWSINSSTSLTFAAYTFFLRLCNFLFDIITSKRYRYPSYNMHIFNNKNIAREPSKPFLSVAVATQLGRTVLEFEHSASWPAPATARSAFEVPVGLDKK